MRFKGYKIRVRCLKWEQVQTIGAYWKKFNSIVNSKKIVGLGIEPLNQPYFDYALGSIDDEETLEKMKAIDFSDTNFKPTYIELELPDLNDWQTFAGKSNNIQYIYEEKIDAQKRRYDYELEYMDEEGNIEIKIHFID